MPTLFPQTSDLDQRVHPYVALVAKHWAFVLVALLLGAAAGFGLSQLAPKSYSSTSTLYFSINYGDSGSDLNQGATFAQSQMLSFAELARSARVLDPVIDSLDLDSSVAELASTIDARTPENTVVLDVVARSANAELAASIANATAESLTDAVQEVAPRNDAGRATVTVRTVERAEPATFASSPNTRVNAVAGALIGLVGAILVIVLRRLLSTRVRTPLDLERASGLRVLASIDDDPDAATAPILTRDAAHPASEGYRRLGAVVERVQREAKHPAGKAKPATTIAITGAVPGQGSSTVATNLALALAEGGNRVQLVGSPVTAPGLDVIEVTPDLVDDPTGLRELLSSSVRRRPNDVDFIIIDAPSLATSAAVAGIGHLLSGVVLVADSHSVHAGELRAAVDELAIAGVAPIGAVLNRVGRHHRSSARKGNVLPTARWPVSALSPLENN